MGRHNSKVLLFGGKGRELVKEQVRPPHKKKTGRRRRGAWVFLWYCSVSLLPLRDTCHWLDGLHRCRGSPPDLSALKGGFCQQVDGEREGGGGETADDSRGERAREEEVICLLLVAVQCRLGFFVFCGGAGCVGGVGEWSITM